MLAAAFPRWHVHPEVVLLVAALAVGYHLLVQRGAAAGKRTTPAQQRLWYTGVAVLFVGASWPMHDLAETRLYSFHMVQHTLFTLVMAPLLLQGTPAWLARALLGRGKLFAFVKAVSRPLPALVLFNLGIVFSHLPGVVDLSLRSEPFHFAVHVALVLTALAMWMPVLSPLPEIPRLAPLVQMVYLFLQSLVPTVPASFLTLSDTVLYKAYATFPRLWGVSALTDQLVAGLIMKLVGGLILWGFIALRWFQWANREQEADREAARLGVHRVGSDTEVLTWEQVRAEFERVPPARPAS